MGKLVSEENFFTQTSDENIDESDCDSSDFSMPIDTLNSSEPVDDDTWFIYEDAALNINGIFDLTMLGLEHLDIEKRYLNELEEYDYNPQRYSEQSVFVRSNNDVCKLLRKLEPSPVYEDKEFIGDIIKNFLETNENFFDESIDHNYDYETLSTSPKMRQL